MRREGYEVLVSRPTVIKREIDGKMHEPFETLYLEVPDECVGGCMQSIATRKGKVEAMNARNGRTSIEADIPTRGLIGFEFELLNLTSGEGIMSHLFKEYRPDSGDIRTRNFRNYRHPEITEEDYSGARVILDGDRATELRQRGQSLTELRTCLGCPTPSRTRPSTRTCPCSTPCSSAPSSGA